MLGLSSGLQAQVELTALDFNANDWVDPGQSISFRLSHLPEIGRGKLVFFIGTTDISALVTMRSPGEFNYRASILPLPQGEQFLRVFLVHDSNQWMELATAPIRVLSQAGFEQSEVTPRFDVNSQATQTEQSFDPNLDAQKESAKSLSLQGGVSTRHQRGDLEIRSNWNIVGSSEQQQALRFFSKANDAPKVDLSDYLVEVDKGQTSFQLGHVTYGNNPLLMNGVANRGITGTWRPSENFDMSLSLQNGQSVVGWSNLVGMADTEDNRIAGFGLGFDLFSDSPGQLRIDLTLMDAKITSEDNFNFGEVTDAQLSSGIGLVLQASNASGRLRANLTYARSRFENPADPFLQQDLDIVESEQSTDSARSISIDYDILQAGYDEETLPLALSIRLSHNQTDPFYSSAGAFLTPDLRDNAISFNGQIGQMNWQAQYNETRDNLDDLDTILTTLTDNTNLSLSMPIRGLMDDAPSYVPESINLTHQKTHQYGDNLPPSFDADTHIPDQVSKQFSASLDWSFGSASLSYSLAKSDQDNRQTGREQADFSNTDHSISLNTSLSDNLNLNLSIGRTRAEDVEQDLIRYTNNSSMGLDWAINESLSFSTNVSLTDEDDSLDQATSDNESLQAQLSYRFSMPGAAGKRLPGQAFIRYSSNDSNSVDNVFQFESENTSKSWNAGLNLSFF